MSANYFARAVRPLGRSTATAVSTRPSTATITGRSRVFSTSAIRRKAAPRISAEQTASTWTGPGVLAVAAVAGLLGWGVASLSGKEFPGAMRLDSRIVMPRYASMRDMEVVGFVVATPDLGIR